MTVQKMSATINLLRILPATLKIAWLLLLLGMLALAAGYFTHTPWQSYSGLVCLMGGYVMAILDMVNRKRHRGDAARFYVGVALAPLIAVIILAFVALLAAVVLAIHSWIHGFEGSYAMRLLHFLGIVFAFLLASGIPALALRSSPSIDS
ncbi:hypothetical protein SAMN02745181_1228 [Rubritalea squalenifaciens DSM 18772]|uniref:Transmembrane protein n=1 Tax=Rubritalea squalenifaciens DSM 18772 TaxID=1123071 RepID=A0A1M6GQ12_9BACT|nr:hypothetical protein [Rubritalea squalenifaciens]SHJ11982.1 hypothetical protein SAMN02745181_1228 [Rubritalea squalenifaciens DSM 18772]